VGNTFRESTSLAGKPPYGRLDVRDNYIEFGSFKISFINLGNVLKYLREGGTRVEKIITYSPDTYFLINPIEPVSLPKPLTNFILLEFAEPVVIAPSSTIEAYATFPIEVGVFVINAKNSELLDVFSLVNQKYTLYGTPRNGIICRYWRTGISTEVPKVDLLREGVLKLKISNVSDYWITLSNLVLSVNGMTIYYDDNHVSSSAQATIFSQTYAETSFTDEPLKEGMSKSLIVRSQKRLPVIRERFVMEWGLQ